MAFIEIRQPSTGKLLFRYDPDRSLVEIQERKITTVVDLTSVNIGVLQFSVNDAIIEQKIEQPQMVNTI